MKGSYQQLNDWLQTIGWTETFVAFMELYSDDAIFVVNKEKQIISWNLGAEKLLGYSKEEVLGQHCRMANRCSECMVGCPLQEHGLLKDTYQTMFRKDGTSVDIEKRAIGFFDEHGNFLGGLESLRSTDSNVEEIVEKLIEEEEVEVLDELITKNKKMKDVFQLIRNISETETTVHIHGESGTGKELVAKAIHKHSLRRDGPFVTVNCGALSKNLIESELFGHEKGAFTGAVSAHKGLFQEANNGTIFLDEIGELPIELQPKLLRVLENKEVTPVGSSKPIKVNIRILSATHKSLKKQAQLGMFREDLMYRLVVVPLRLVPLRKRVTDIELLAWNFIQRNNETGLRTVTSISPKVMRVLFEYSWPGNVRELKNVIDYSFAVGRGAELLFEELPLELLEDEIIEKIPQTKARAQRRSAEEEYKEIKQVLGEEEGNIGAAAARLGMSRATLWRKRKKYNL